MSLVTATVIDGVVYQRMQRTAQEAWRSIHTANARSGTVVVSQIVQILFTFEVPKKIQTPVRFEKVAFCLGRK